MAGYAVATLRRVPATSISRSFVRANPPFSRAQHSIPRSHSQLVLLALKWDFPLGNLCVCGQVTVTDMHEGEETRQGKLQVPTSV
jgi:hypothetical protein